MTTTLVLGACAHGGLPGTIEPAELATRLNGQNGTNRGADPLILDVRAATEFASGHIPGALNIPHNQLGDRLDELTAGKGQEIVVYCRSGGRAAIAEGILRDAGYRQVRVLTGHIAQWQADGHPLTR